MQIRIPEEISGGGDLKLIPPGLYQAIVKDTIVKTAKSSGAPVAILRWTLLSEPENGNEAFTNPTEVFPTTGETVLDMYSLQDQALWRLNELHKTLTGERLPAKDYSPEEFKIYLDETLTGKEATLILINEPNNKGEDRVKVESVSR